MNKSLYVFRPLLNGNEVRDWMKQAGFNTSLAAPDMHVTQMYSKEPVNWGLVMPQIEPILVEGGNREIEHFDGGATVLQFQCNQLQTRWRELMDAGCSYDYPSFKAHITLTYDEQIHSYNDAPYWGPLHFGGERFQEITGSYEPDAETPLGRADMNMAFRNMGGSM